MQFVAKPFQKPFHDFFFRGVSKVFLHPRAFQKVLRGRVRETPQVVTVALKLRHGIPSQLPFVDSSGPVRALLSSRAFTVAFPVENFVPALGEVSSRVRARPHVRSRDHVVSVTHTGVLREVVRSACNILKNCFYRDCKFWRFG